MSWCLGDAVPRRTAPREILHATEPLLARIAPQQRPSRSIRHGEHPTVSTVAEEDIGSVLNELITHTRKAHPGELIGVVTTAQRAATLDADINETDVTIIAVPDARGLEFDTVIIIDPDGIQSANEAGVRDLYVAQTRATKRLLTLEVTTNTTVDESGERGSGACRPSVLGSRQAETSLRNDQYRAS